MGDPQAGDVKAVDVEAPLGAGDLCPACAVRRLYLAGEMSMFDLKCPCGWGRLRPPSAVRGSES